MFKDGPDVSLKGSPTVSPTTEALCASLPFPPKFPSSMYFLALSIAPPAFAMNTASKNPVTTAPASNPPRASGPRRKPTTTGTITANAPGSIISLSAASVEIAIHFS